MRTPFRAHCHLFIPASPLPSIDAEPKNAGYTLTLPRGKFMPPTFLARLHPLSIGKLLYPILGPFGLNVMYENLDI